MKTMLKSILSRSDMYAFAEVPLCSFGRGNLPTIALMVVKKDGASTDPAYATIRSTVYENNIELCILTKKRTRRSRWGIVDQKYERRRNSGYYAQHQHGIFGRRHQWGNQLAESPSDRIGC